MLPGLIRNQRETECGANQFLARFEVRAAPFALLRECGTAPSLSSGLWYTGSPVAPVLLCPLYWFQSLAGFVSQNTNFERPREGMAGGLVVGGETDDANNETTCKDRINGRSGGRLVWVEKGLTEKAETGSTWAGTHGRGGSTDRCFPLWTRYGCGVAGRRASSQRAREPAERLVLEARTSLRLPYNCITPVIRCERSYAPG